MSAPPPAMANSSIVPITRSNLRQDALQVRGDAVGGDEAGLAVAALGQSPQHRPVVDVEHRAHVVARARSSASVADAVDVLRREVRAGDQQRARAARCRLRRRRRPSIAMSAQFSRRKISGKVSLSLMPSTTGAGQALRVDADVRWCRSLPRERLDAGSGPLASSPTREIRPRLEAQARAAEGGVGRRPAEVLGEAGARPPAARRSAARRGRRRSGRGR